MVLMLNRLFSISSKIIMRRIRAGRQLALYFLFVLICLETAVYSADWPAFRGPAGNGVSTEAGFPTKWSPDQNVKWRVELPEPGNGSPIVVGDRVFVTCAQDQGRRRTLYAFDRNSGQELWKQTVEFSIAEETHKTNPHCSTTPLSDGERVYVWHGSAGMHAYTLAGEPVWSRDLGEFKHIWGLGASPVLYGDTIIQFCGPSARAFHIALDRQTGETRWETPVEANGSDGSGARFMGSWITPVLTEANGRDQLVSAYQTRIVSLDPKSGEELWTIDGVSSGRSDLIYASPMLTSTHGVAMGGYQGPEFGFRLDGSGDVTATHRLWRNEKSADGGNHPQRIGTGITIGNHLFMANADDAGSFECLDVTTGQRKWTQRRTKDGAHWGSLVLTGDVLYVTGQSGITHVLLANPDKFEPIAENDLGEPSNSTPALSNGDIFLRTFNALYCISDR